MSGAGTFDGSGYNAPVTAQRSDLTRVPEQRQEYLSPAERGLREYYRVQKLLADAETERQREQAEIRKRREQLERQAEQEKQRQQTKAIFDATQELLEQTIQMHGLTDEEESKVWDEMLRTKQVNMEACEIFCQEIKLRRA